MDIKWTSITNEEEKRFLKKVVEYSHKSFTQNRELYTDFYNGDWMKEVINKYIGIRNLHNYIFIGGYDDAERQVLGFVNDEAYIYENPVCAVKVIVKTGLGKNLTHRDFLGAILNLGIDRSKIGDIIIKPFGAYIILDQEIREFIRWNLTQIARYSQIEMEEIELDKLEIDAPNLKEIQGTVSGLRADAVFAVAFGISRTTASKLLQNDKGRCNGIPISSSSLLKEGDKATLRGYGKMHLKAVNGMTKKDRMHITIEKYI
ncbi:MAG: RNA-binding protein [Cellulosilyticaceae bacterium]